MRKLSGQIEDSRHDAVIVGAMGPTIYNIRYYTRIALDAPALSVLLLLYMAIKYKAYFKSMLEDHAQEFGRFKGIHDLYAKDKKTHQAAYNDEGKVIVELVREYERKLCGHMEKGNNAVYSARLAEKFWGEVRSMFPLIDFVGAVVKN